MSRKCRKIRLDLQKPLDAAFFSCIVRAVGFSTVAGGFMNYESAKRVSLLVRQSKALASQRRSGDLTEAEYRALVAPLNDEIAAIRSQTDLPLQKPAKG